VVPESPRTAIALGYFPDAGALDAAGDCASVDELDGEAEVTAPSEAERELTPTTSIAKAGSNSLRCGRPRR